MLFAPLTLEAASLPMARMDAVEYCELEAEYIDSSSNWAAPFPSSDN